MNFSENKYLKMQDCGDFNDLRMDQRFEVRNDELASICSKFAAGGFSNFFHFLVFSLKLLPCQSVRGRRNSTFQNSLAAFGRYLETTHSLASMS